MPCDYSKYPPNWKSEIVPRILVRAGEVRDESGEIAKEANCEKCGIENHSTKCNGTFVVLTIAHLDHDSENHNVKDERLAAYCQACHLKYDHWRHVAKRKYGAAFFKTQQQLF